MAEVKYVTLAEFEAGLNTIRQAPQQEGILALIVRRPAMDEREVLKEAKLDLVEGLVGDRWSMRGNSRIVDGSADPDAQLTLMNVRVIELLTQAKDRWPLAGDQLFVDLDLSLENLPVGTRLALGSATIEVTAKPHTGCSKFMARFGSDAVKFINSSMGKQLRLRGLNAKVVQPGIIRVGDQVKKLGGNNCG